MVETDDLGIDTVLGKAACALPLHVILPGELREAPAKTEGAQWGCTHKREARRALTCYFNDAMKPPIWLRNIQLHNVHQIGLRNMP